MLFLHVFTLGRGPETSPALGTPSMSRTSPLAAETSGRLVHHERLGKAATLWGSRRLDSFSRRAVSGFKLLKLSLYRGNFLLESHDLALAGIPLRPRRGDGERGTTEGQHERNNQPYDLYGACHILTSIRVAVLLLIGELENHGRFLVSAVGPAPRS